MDGQKQNKKSVTRDTTTPTVSAKSILITSTIDENERSNPRICDIPGALISAYMGEDVKFALCGRIDEQMGKIGAQKIYR